MGPMSLAVTVSKRMGERQTLVCRQPYAIQRASLGDSHGAGRRSRSEMLGGEEKIGLRRAAWQQVGGRKLLLVIVVACGPGR